MEDDACKHIPEHLHRFLDKTLNETAAETDDNITELCRMALPLMAAIDKEVGSGSVMDSYTQAYGEVAMQGHVSPPMRLSALAGLIGMTTLARYMAGQMIAAGDGDKTGRQVIREKKEGRRGSN